MAVGEGIIAIRLVELVEEISMVKESVMGIATTVVIEVIQILLSGVTYVVGKGISHLIVEIHQLRVSIVTKREISELGAPIQEKLHNKKIRAPNPEGSFLSVVPKCPKKTT